MCTLEADTSNLAGAEAPSTGCIDGASLKARSSTGIALRMGFRYAKGLREETAQAILRERDQRPFDSIADLTHRVPELRRNELVLLASIGALNSIGCSKQDRSPRQPRSIQPETFGRAQQRLHRRDALWQVERAARFAGPLLESIPEIDE